MPVYVIIYKGTTLWMVYVRDNGEQEFSSRTAATKELERLKSKPGQNYENAKVIRCL